MSAPIANGGPAFPFAKEMETIAGLHFSTGMTLRDWFAGQALLAIASRFPNRSEAADIACQSTPVAEDCYKIADAMIAARKGGQA